MLVEQTDAGIAACAATDTHDPHAAHEAVHEVRRCLKKARAALRLGRGALDAGAFERENDLFRSVGRSISQLRDAKAVVEATEELAERFADDGPSASLDGALGAMRRLRDEAAAPAELQRALEDAGAELADARGRIAEISFDGRGEGFGVIARGLRRTYRDARRAMREACRGSHDEARHDWRKRVKDHRYHVQLLRLIWPAALEPRLHELHRLTDLLGADHDLATLGALLPLEPGLDAAELSPLIERRRAEFVAAAWPLSARLFAERPSAFVERMGRIWDAPDLVSEACSA